LETQARVKAVQSEAQTHQNDPIRQNLLPMCTYHDYLVQRGLSEETCRALGIGYLPQGRSPLRGRMIFQIRDERLNEKTSERETVTLSHMGRAIDGKTKPKYLFYEGFHKSAELYAQDIIWRDPKAKQQIADTGYLVLTEGPFDVAKAYESGLRNVVASFGANLSNRQAELLESICHQRGASSILVAYDRDKSGRDGIEKARAKLESLGVPTHVFDWDIRLSINDGRRVSIPRSIGDIADFSVDQLKWLRRKRLI
ncbi:MAG: toprim domain-containing protein, partial [Pseudomonadota bacterium]